MCLLERPTFNHKGYFSYNFFANLGVREEKKGRVKSVRSMQLIIYGRYFYRSGRLRHGMLSAQSYLLQICRKGIAKCDWFRLTSF